MIENELELRNKFAQPGDRAVKKQMDTLDKHCRRFIELSPFLVLSTVGASGLPDTSPRGGEAGFVKIVDDKTLHIPDAKGNNRLDSMTNILATGTAGLLFLVPGVDETLRVNGSARLLDDPAALAAFCSAKHPPKVVIEVKAFEVFLHCAKALMRSKLWSPEAQVDRSVLPTMGEMLKDQIGAQGPVESQEQMLERYRKDL